MIRELLASPGVVEVATMAGPVGVMALHGGIEAETAELAHEISEATGASRYIVTQPDDLAWHIPSVRYRPDEVPALAAFLGHVRSIISIHGFGRAQMPKTVLVGGANRVLAVAIGASLRAGTQLKVVDQLDAIPHGLRGCHPANPVNLAAGGGVQLELSGSARRAPHRAALAAVLIQHVRGMAPA